MAFVNGGILGLLTYGNWLRRTFTNDDEILAEFFILTEHLTLRDRIVRRALSQRLVPNVRPLRNLDLLRYRNELNSGLVARRRLLARGLDHFDVLHFHHQAAAYASLDLLRRVPSIVTIDCTQRCALQQIDTAPERWSLSFNVRRDGEIFNRAVLIIAESRWAERDLRSMYPSCRTPIHVLHNPVTLELFDATWMDERRARASERPRCLFMGGDFPRKGGYDLLDAWEHGGFARRATLHVVTDWNIRRRIPDGVHVQQGVVGHSPQWEAVWRNADLFVMPTRNEAFGLVFQEAAAAGLPAIGTRLNAIPEIVADGRTGLLVTPGNRDELIAALDRLIGDAELRHRMGIAARRKIEVDGNPASHRRRLIALIKYAVGAYGR